MSTTHKKYQVLTPIKTEDDEFIGVNMFDTLEEAIKERDRQRKLNGKSKIVSLEEKPFYTQLWLDGEYDSFDKDIVDGKDY